MGKTNQILVRRNFELLKSDLNHSSLSFKKVGEFWSARFGINYRTLAFKQTSQEKMAEDMKNLSYSDQIEYLQKKINESDLKLWWESINKQ